MNDSFAEKAKMWDSNPQVRALADLFSAELDKIVPNQSGLAILEFGCGTGLVGLRYAEKAASLDMVDTSPAMLDVLRDNGFEPHELARLFENGGFTSAKTHTFLTMPREDNDGLTRTYSAFILDTTRSVTK